MSHVELRIRPRRVLLAVLVGCVTLELLFVWLDWQVNYGRWTTIGALRRLTNITREDGLAGWFQPVQTLLVALTLWTVWLVERRAGGSRRAAIGWAVVAAFFTYLAVDDGTKLHERFGTAARIASERGGGPLSSALARFPSYAWQVVFLPALTALGLFTLVFLWRRLVDGVARLLVVAGLGCLALAVGLDFVEGLPRRHALNVQTRVVETVPLDRFSRRRFGRSAPDTVEHFAKALEETLEAFGTTLLWLACLHHLMARTGELRLRFAESAPPAAAEPAED